MKRTTSKTVVKHLRNLADFLEQEDKGTREDAASELNELLDNLLDMDMFGTEGQNDPRGDHRE